MGLDWIKHRYYAEYKNYRISFNRVRDGVKYIAWRIEDRNQIMLGCFNNAENAKELISGIVESESDL